MVDLKKIITTKKIKKFILKKPIILLYHYNNMNAFDWISLKKDLSNTQIKILKIKNKRTLNNNLVEYKTLYLKKNIYKLKKKISLNLPFDTAYCDNKQKITRNKMKNLNVLYQGPTLIATCESFDCLQKLHTSLKKYKKFVLIGGEIKNQKITHLDFNYLLQLNSSIYSHFINYIKSYIYTILLFKKVYNLSYLNIYTYKLIFILRSLLSKKTNVA